MNNFEKLYSKNRPINIAHEHCFDVTLADFEQIWYNFCVISLKTKTSKFPSEITYFFQLSLFSNLKPTP